MPAPAEIVRLVAQFARHRDEYTSGTYNETQTRRDFIDPFLKALGWDVDNSENASERYREVVHEDKVQVGGETKAPDYSCRLGGNRIFFVEAKKPGVDLKNAPEPSFQLRRYAWSAKLPVSVLTDFEELVIFDTTAKPKSTDKATVGRLRYWTFEEYVEKWDEIAKILSKDAVKSGDFDKFANERKRKSTDQVDNDFLEAIEEWRDLLARDIAKENAKLESEDLSTAVQRILDRIIFLRICEDRGIEQPGRLHALVNGPHIYARLTEMFDLADKRYNSGLFHFKEEAGRHESPDTITKKLKVGDKALKKVIDALYIDAPWAFAVIPADILGSIYERFLGKTILRDGRGVRIEEKPEVRKAGGVYYTPKYIVDYIVKETVGKQLEGKTPKEAAELRVLDPACGSGSFLIGAYQYLLDWHLDQYRLAPEKFKKQVVELPKGIWRLTSAERKRILLNSIFGVDIDPQAVEVTKLSLLLKVLEGETGHTLQIAFDLSPERALPDLGDNVKCGNSLLDSSYFCQGELLHSMDDKAGLRVFDWSNEFPAVFGGKGRGFSVVIGNPPYIRIQELQDSAPLQVAFYKRAYKAAEKGNVDIYVAFIERATQLTGGSGRVGMILPHKFMNASYGATIRGLVASHVDHLVHFGPAQVFDGATTYTCLLFLTPHTAGAGVATRVDDLGEWSRGTPGRTMSIDFDSGEHGAWVLTTKDADALVARLASGTKSLEALTSRIFQGLKTSADKVYILEKLGSTKRGVRVYSRHTDREYELEAGLLHPLIKGGDSRAFMLAKTNLLILFPYMPNPAGDVELVSSKALKVTYPATWAYLDECRSFLRDREEGKMAHEGWYGYIYPKALEVIDKPKLITPDIAPSPAFSWDRDGEVFFTGGAAGGYGITPATGVDSALLLAALNGPVCDWMIRRTSTQMRGGWYSFEARYIRGLPIPVVSDKATLAEVRALVGRLLEIGVEGSGKGSDFADVVADPEWQIVRSKLDQLILHSYGVERSALVE